jgi:UTP-glucose-1-phosphate uridylyltransferase/mevalonate kinase
MQSSELRAIADTDSYFSYGAGVASYVKDHYTVGGLKITIRKMTLPTKKGLSSSAAICVLIARAFNKLYALNLNIRGEMDIAYKGEQRTRSRCGRLDQACAFGVVPVCMHFNGDDIMVERLIIKDYFYWVFADLNAKKNTIKILNDLNKCYPFAETDLDHKVHEALGERNQNIIRRAIEYFKNGNAMELGKLMIEAQEIFDTMIAPASPVELAAPKLHSFLKDKTIMSLAFGAKGVGSQGDGAIQFLAKDEKAQNLLSKYLLEKGLTPFILTIKPCHKVRKAIIPIAGYGTRLYPSTRFVKKEMLPLIDKDGLVKPAILILLEQLNDAGIEEICLVVGSEDEIITYQNYFRIPFAEEHLDKLPEFIKDYEQKIQSIGRKVSFRIQKERLGFGHAVFQCYDFCDGEPVLLILGDTVYSSHEKRNCFQQLIELYEIYNNPLIAIHKIPFDKVQQYGILSGVWLDLYSRMKITNFVEKPDPYYAKKNLSMKGMNEVIEYYAVFGQYILQPEIFDILKKSIFEQKYSKEIDMTDAFCVFIGKGLTGVVLNGTMYDLGNPGAYKEAFALFDKVL